jgi:CRP/FNR family transcriptional regulator
MTEWLPLDELERLLASVDVFEPLAPPQLRALARGATLERLGAEEGMTVEPGEHAGRVIVLLAGRVAVYEPGPRGRGLTLSVAEAGIVVGVAGLSERTRGLRIGATKPSLLCLVAFGAFEGVARRNPKVGLRLVRVLGERIGVLERRLAELAYGGVVPRLAGAILRLVEGEGVMGSRGARLPTRYTHRQLGSMIGANREAVTRALGTLRGRGIIETKERRIRVVDLGALRRAARQA